MQSPIVAVVLATVLIASSCSHDLGPDDQHNTFEALTKVLNEEKTKPSLSYRDVGILFLKLHFQNCTNGRSSNTTCWKCFTVSDLYQHFNLVAGSELNETSFARVSPAIVYHLLPEKNPGSSGQSGGCTSSLPKSLFAAFSNNKTEITLPVLDEALENVNKSLGKSLTKKKCFSARSVLHDVKSIKDEEHGYEEKHGDANSLDKDQFEKACAAILSHLVQGYCIEEDHGELPPKSFFLDNLFENTTHLSEDKLLKVTKKLEIGTQSAPEKDSHAGHNHRRRRSLDDQKNSNTFNHRISRRSTDEHDHSSNTSYEGKCYSLDNLFKVFDVDHSVGATKSQLKELCPSLLQQFISGSCSATKHTTSSNHGVTKSEVWGYGFVAVTAISLTSLIGVGTIPFVGKKIYKKVMSLLVALAVASLSGDALLHMIPHSFGLHDHSAESTSGDSHGHGHGHGKVPDFIWKALIVIVSIYCFYLFETLMHFAMVKKRGKQGHSHGDIEIPGPSSRHMSFNERNCDMREHHSGIPAFPEENGKSVTENGVTVTNVNSVSESAENMASPHNSDKVKPKPQRKRSLKASLSQKSVFSKEEGFKRNKDKRILPIGWMIIIGDTLHNISDGLAIGAAFSEPGSSGFAGGISTSIAVFCHELPHELGDFAVLLSAGMSVKKALLANFLSACSCYIGLVIGIQLGQMADVRLWIFAHAGGIFLYIALVDMLPALMQSESLHTDALVTFILQNVGLWVGFGLMLLIAVYEEDLRGIKF